MAQDHEIRLDLRRVPADLNRRLALDQPGGRLKAQLAENLDAARQQGLIALDLRADHVTADALGQADSRKTWAPHFFASSAPSRSATRPSREPS